MVPARTYRGEQDIVLADMIKVFGRRRSLAASSSKHARSTIGRNGAHRRRDRLHGPAARNGERGKKNAQSARKPFSDGLASRRSISLGFFCRCRRRRRACAPLLFGRPRCCARPPRHDARSTGVFTALRHRRIRRERRIVFDGGTSSSSRQAISRPRARRTTMRRP